MMYREFMGRRIPNGFAKADAEALIERNGPTVTRGDCCQYCQDGMPELLCHGLNCNYCAFSALSNVDIQRLFKELGVNMDNNFLKLKAGHLIQFAKTDEYHSRFALMMNDREFIYVKTVIDKDGRAWQAMDGWDLIDFDRDGNEFTSLNNICVVYASDATDDNGHASFVCPGIIRKILSSYDSGNRICEDKCVNIVWKREDPMELTVEQIEKELGYKVKIVGSDK